MKEFIIIIKVFCNPGEESISINKVSNIDLEVLMPLLNNIKAHNGYFPTGTFLKKDGPSARELYRPFQGWDILRSILPEPLGGFQAILEITLIDNIAMKFEML